MLPLKIAQFASITDIHDPDLASQILEASGWNVEVSAQPHILAHDTPSGPHLLPITRTVMHPAPFPRPHPPSLPLTPTLPLYTTVLFRTL